MGMKNIKILYIIKIFLKPIIFKWIYLCDIQQMIEQKIGKTSQKVFLVLI